MGALREYQQDLLDKFFAALEGGYKAPCIVLPCGGGKSVITAEIAKKYTLQKKQVLFLVHRKELCDQIYNTFLSYGCNMDFCSIAMVQTAVRRLGFIQRPDLIITDENHHSLAGTYKKIYKYFSDIPRVGVTATPERMNGAGLADVNDVLIQNHATAKWLIDHKFLAPFDYYAPPFEMPKLHIKNGDYNRREFADYLNRQKIIYGDMVKNYRKIADGKQAICYLPTVEVSEEAAQRFTLAGINAAHIDGKTPKAQRDNIIESFRRGEIKILCNVDIISEGFDVPDCECVILLRPTKSLILYTQQSMRCMRFKEGKRAVIIDHVNNISRFGFPDTEREWLLEGHPKKKGQFSEAAHVKTCKNCFAVVPSNTKICPHCGEAFESEKRKSRPAKKIETDLVNLKEEYIKQRHENYVRQRVSGYISPNECQSTDELREYAKQHGYKPGWVYYQQKSKGWLNNAKVRNNNSRRYPCRAVRGWDSNQK